MRPIKFKKRIYSPLFIAFFLLLLILLILNQWRIFSTAQKSVEEEKAALGSQQLKVETIDKLKKNGMQIISRLRDLQYMIPDDQDHADILGYLQLLFSKYNIDIIQLQFDSYIQGENYIELPIDISFRGQYTQIIDFLKDLGTGSKPFRIDEFNIRTQNYNDPVVHCDILIYGFFKAETD